MKSFTIKSRLIFAVGFLSLVIIGINIGAIHSLRQSNNALKSVYEDRLLALENLNGAIVPLLSNQTVFNKSLTDDPNKLDNNIALIEANTEQIQTKWKEYDSTVMTSEERQLADQFNSIRKEYVEKVYNENLAALKAHDIEKSTKLIKELAPDYLRKMNNIMKRLIAIQLAEGKSQYSHSQEQYKTFNFISIAVMILGIAIGAVMTIWLNRSISNPLKNAISIADAVAKGDLTQRIEIKSHDETGKLLQALQSMTDNLRHLVIQVTTGTGAISTASKEIAAGNLDLSSRTEQQAASLEETAASMEELTSTVKNNTANAQKANDLVAQASSSAVEGGHAVEEVVKTMNSINDSSKKIVDIIAVIDSIAFQTNILALNAAVEAARAGEQGRGFAVVASEVRNLAQRSASAAKEIKELINTSVENISHGNIIVHEAGNKMSQIVVSVGKVNEIMSEIALAGKEQESGINLINQAIVEMDSVTQQNAALVEQAAAAAQSLQDQANNLDEVVHVFKIS